MTIPFENDDPWQDRLSEYLDGLVTEPDKRALEDHVKTCERCRSALVELRSVVERLHADRVDEVPQGVWPRIASRLSTRSPLDTRFASGWVRRSSHGVQTATLRKITAVAALTLTLVSGIWTGAYLCLAGSAWTPPGWMHISPRGPYSLPSRARRTSPSYATDSIVDEWTPLRRSLSDLDQQLADATRALENEPGNKSLQRMVQQLSRERGNLRTLLDSAALLIRRHGLPQR